jgi:hypothetical protein
MNRGIITLLLLLGFRATNRIRTSYWLLFANRQSHAVHRQDKFIAAASEVKAMNIATVIPLSIYSAEVLLVELLVLHEVRVLPLSWPPTHTMVLTCNQRASSTVYFSTSRVLNVGPCQPGGERTYVGLKPRKVRSEK